MKKPLIATLSSILLTTSILTPIAAASEKSNQITQSYTQNHNQNNELPKEAPKNFNEEQYINDVLKSQNINYSKGYQDPNTDQVYKGKIGITVKGAMEIIKKNKTKLQGIINSGIDKLPLSKSVKKHWKKVITVDALLEALGHYTNLGDNVEGAITNALKDMGMPGWIATALAKTITFAIPVL